VVGKGVDVNVNGDVVDTPLSVAEGVATEEIRDVVGIVVADDVVADVAVVGVVGGGVVVPVPVVVEDTMVDAEVVSVVVEVVMVVVVVETGDGTASIPGADVELICKSGTGNPKQ
jgi:hypothetical protein